MLRVDLRQAGLDADLLTAPKVAAAAPISDQARAAGAVAGVNGDFFDIGESDAALGFEIKSGELRKSASQGSARVAAVARDRGVLTKLALDATLRFGGREHVVDGINLAEVGENSIVVYDHQWGDYPRADEVGDAAREVIVTNGVVGSVSDTPGSGTLPERTLALVGRGTGADELASLEPGDQVEFRSATVGAPRAPLDFAVGSGVFLVRDGEVPETIPGEDGHHPRTAIGFGDGGSTMLLAIADGRQGQVVLGPTRLEMAELMSDLGAEDAMLLDGGGSTTLVARALGETEAKVRNVPSDGSERSDPNGVGVFLAPGDGVPRKLIVRPAGEKARVFPGLHREVSVRAIDDRDAPLPLDPNGIRWSPSVGAVSARAYRAPAGSSGPVRLRARSGSARGKSTLTVLGPMRSLEASNQRVAIPETTSSPAVLRITGRDTRGYAAPIDPADMALDYDRSVIEVSEAGNALRIAPAGNGSTVLRIEVGHEVAEVPVAVGFGIQLLSAIQGLHVITKSLSIGDPDIEPAAIRSPTGPPQPDRLIDADGVLSTAGRRFQFAVLTNLRLTSEDPEGVRAAVEAMRRIRAQGPDFVVLNGDIVDAGSEADLGLARRTLEEGGCDFVAARERVPEPTTHRVPCMYVPGNREAGRTGDLEPWEAEFGQPYRTFDHQGIRFILLNSSRGTLRTSDWDQLPMLQAAVTTAAADPAVTGVIVFAHHRASHPGSPDAGQLDERKEARLIERMLSDFHADSGKGVAMIGSRAGAFEIERIEGVPYLGVGRRVRLGVDPAEGAITISLK